MTIEKIKQVICSVSEITIEQLESKNRQHRFAVPRHLYFRLISVVYPIMTLNEMAGTLRHKKHYSTIISSLRTAGDLIFTGHCRNNYYRILIRLGYTDAEALAEIKRPAWKREDVRGVSAEDCLIVKSGGRICCL